MTKHPEATPQNLYQITGNVADMNTVLIERAELRRLQAENDGVQALIAVHQRMLERCLELKAECAELEAMLDAVGAGGVGQSIKPPVQPDTAQIPDVRIRTSAPDGWKLVPVQPTDDMFIEGMEADCRGRPSIDDDKHVRSIWRAMLSSAPDAPQPPAAQQAPVAGARCKIIDNCKSCQHSAGRQSCMLANRAFEGRERPPTPPDWCPLPLYTTPQPTENLRCKSTQKRLAMLWGYVKQDLARQPLTDEQIVAVADKSRAAEAGDAGYILPISFARAIEEACGITGGQQ